MAAIMSVHGVAPFGLKMQTMDGNGAELLHPPNLRRPLKNLISACPYM
jgi:hypothetical protein